MYKNQKIIVVLPAYNAERTLKKTVLEIPESIVDEVILVDDFSSDNTIQQAKALNLETIVHESNLGYGANQKTCYTEALKRQADIVVMLHPDYQYDPGLISKMVPMLIDDGYDLVLGSRFLNNDPRLGAMPWYKYYANRILSTLANILLGQTLSEYHTGYRAFKVNLLAQLPFHKYANGFIFDNQFLVDSILYGFKLGELSCPARYFSESSTISFFSSCIYGVGVLLLMFKGFLTITKNKYIC